MADYNSSLPVRTEADVDERLQSKIIDYTDPNSGMSVVSGNAYVQVHGLSPSGVDETLRLSELGHMTLDGVYDATDNTDPSNVAVVLHQRNASPGDAQSTLRQTAIQNGTVIAADVAIRDENGDPFSSTNPIYATLVPGAGAKRHDYNTVASVAANASSTHTYTVTGTPLELCKVWASASGKMKVEVQVNAATVFVGFNSTANTNIDIGFCQPLVVPVGQAITVIRTNRDNQAQDVYSTIVGIQQ